jgi:endonuclease/exonuclease/phosphatase family metal-dependent hydrolase
MVARWAAVAIVAFCAACNDDETPPTGTSGAPLRVVTWNLYLGADFTPLLSATPPSGISIETALGRTYEAVAGTDPRARMEQIAGRIAEVGPEAVALQEVALWRIQANPDGTAAPATEPAFDFLALVVDGLARRGLTYDVAVVADNADVEATAQLSSGVRLDVRFTDRDALLVRRDAPFVVTGTAQAKYTANVVVPTIVGAPIDFNRGWVAADLTPSGGGVPPIRVIDTHLEAVADPIRDAQVAELIAGPIREAPSELVVAGDFNLRPDSVPYRALTTAGLTDVWATVAGGDPGPTCCQAADLRNAESMLTERIDLVFVRGGLTPSTAERLGELPSEKTASGLWPSDHAGVAASVTGR